MGCAGIDTYDLESNENSNNNSKNLMIKKHRGLLIKNSKFSDTLIKSDQELNDKLRDFIPLRIKKDNSEELVFNVNDDVLTQSIKVDFNNEYIIALNGVNEVYKVEGANNYYTIFHDNQPSEKDKYIAIVVKKIEGEPTMIFASPKRPF